MDKRAIPHEPSNTGCRKTLRMARKLFIGVTLAALGSRARRIEALQSAEDRPCYSDRDADKAGQGSCEEQRLGAAWLHSLS